MTPGQVRTFRERGVVRLPRAVHPDVALAMRERVWRRVEEKSSLRRAEPETWQRVRPAIMKKVKAEEGLFDPLLGPSCVAALDELLGEGEWFQPDQPGQLLMTPPAPGEWTLPSSMWHLDTPAPSGVDRAGAQLFLLLDGLSHGAGATLVVAGSHRLVRDLPERCAPGFAGHSDDVRRALARRVPWIRALQEAGPNALRMERHFRGWSDHEGTPLRVLELTGEPGDVYLMDLWTLHAGSMNASDRMRMMVAERLFTRTRRRALWGTG